MARFLVVDDAAALGVWLTAALAGAACTDASEAVEPAGSAASEPVAVDLAGLALTAGAAEATVSVMGQGARDIAVWMPEGPGPHPLALFLHGGVGETA